MEPKEFKKYCDFVNEAFILKNNKTEKKITPKLKKIKEYLKKVLF